MLTAEANRIATKKTNRFDEELKNFFVQIYDQYVNTKLKIKSYNN